MYRIQASAISSTDDNWSIFDCCLEMHDGTTWMDSPYAEHASVTSTWAVAGVDSDLIPISVTGASNALRPDDYSNYNPPNFVNLDLTNVDTLQICRCVVVAIIEDATGSRVDTVTHQTIHDDYTQLGVSALKGTHTLVCMPISVHPFFSSHLEDGILTMSGTVQVFGLMLDDNIDILEVGDITYVDNTTAVDLTAYGEDITGNLLIASVTETEVELTPGDVAYDIVASQYPFVILDEDHIVTRTTYWFNTTTCKVTVTHLSNQFSVLTPTWVKNLISPDTMADVISVASSALVNITEKSDTVYRPPATVVAGKVYRIHNNTWTLADPTDPAVAICELWVALGTVVTDNGVTCQSVVSDSSWSFSSVGVPVYLGAAGTITTTAPESDVCRIIGFTRGPKTFRFNGHIPGEVVA